MEIIANSLYYPLFNPFIKRTIHNAQVRHVGFLCAIFKYGSGRCMGLHDFFGLFDMNEETAIEFVLMTDPVQCYIVKGYQ